MAATMVSRVLHWRSGASRPPDAGPEAAKTDRASVEAGSVLEARDELGRPMTFRIDSVRPDPKDQDGDTFLYAVSVKPPEGNDWTPYCAPDIDGVAAAIPAKGSWDSTGAYHDGPGLLTLACTSGAIGKCIRWGYKPWKTIGATPLRDYHQACTRMVRADYCGDGRSHTKDGTRIDVFDPLGLQRAESKAGQPEVFEAGWSPSGATYVNIPRWSDAVDEIARECPDRLAGRTAKDEVLTSAQTLLRFPETLVLNNRFVRDEDRVRH